MDDFSSKGKANKEVILTRAIERVGRIDADRFFALISRVLNAIGSTESDPRVSFNVTAAGTVVFIIGNRYCLCISRYDGVPWVFISDKRLKKSEDLNYGRFSGEPSAYLNYARTLDILLQYEETITKACRNEIARTKKSPQLKNNVPFFSKISYDPEFRTKVFDDLSQQVAIPGAIWRLDASLGGGTSFYKMMSKEKFVIGVTENRYAAADLILVTEGNLSLAIAQVDGDPTSADKMPDLGRDLKNNPFGEVDTLQAYGAEWYEVEEIDQFNTFGNLPIAKIDQPELVNRIKQLWEGRNVNYWVFQANPAQYDLVEAVKDGSIDSWRVEAHREEIKTGDRIIIWLTGKASGCYGLAKAISDPEVVPGDVNRENPEARVKMSVSILLTHDFTSNPILTEVIRTNPKLMNMKGGTQGTNFSATKEQFLELIRLSSDKQAYMKKGETRTLNTIFYGPPGTGKTYKLNRIRESEFTDEGEGADTINTREAIDDFPMWKVLGAVLLSSTGSLSVNELLDHFLVRAKIQPTTKNPRQQIWGTLLTYADDTSSKIDERKRSPFKIFHKQQDSRWLIRDDQRTEAMELVGHELMEISAQPESPSITGNKIIQRYTFVTFHQKYGYEDFVEGIKPNLIDPEQEEAGDLQFKVEKGIFYKACLYALSLVGYSSFADCRKESKAERFERFHQAQNDGSKRYALFIDEINRANISAVFGELITLLEPDKRIGQSQEMWVELPTSRDHFSVPPNLYVIGSMNTADRSIALLDIALRRRFDFVGIYPEYDRSAWWGSVLQNLNTAIYSFKKNSDYFIGHAYFIDRPAEEKLDIFNKKILPLLNEYVQGNQDILKKILDEAGIAYSQGGIYQNFQLVAI